MYQVITMHLITLEPTACIPPLWHCVTHTGGGTKGAPPITRLLVPPITRALLLSKNNTKITTLKTALELVSNVKQTKVMCVSRKGGERSTQRSEEENRRV